MISTVFSLDNGLAGQAALLTIGNGSTGLLSFSDLFCVTSSDFIILLLTNVTVSCLFMGLWFSIQLENRIPGWLINVYILPCGLWYIINTNQKINIRKSYSLRKHLDKQWTYLHWKYATGVMMLTVYLKWDFVFCLNFFWCGQSKEKSGFQTSSVCLQLFSVVLPTSHMPAGKHQACKHKNF